VSLHRRRYFFSYGQATDAGAPFTADTLVEIGSCTKVFTTTLFALAVNRNQIDPNASVQRYMPAGYTLRPRARPMTPLELADFTSGLPVNPPNLPRRSLTTAWSSLAEIKRSQQGQLIARPSNASYDEAGASLRLQLLQPSLTLGFVGGDDEGYRFRRERSARR
jgi:CubicO group peptidase (beta-lactamase class C family)